MLAHARQALGWLNDALDRWLFGMFDVNLGHLDEESKTTAARITRNDERNPGGRAWGPW